MTGLARLLVRRWVSARNRCGEGWRRWSGNWRPCDAGLSNSPGNIAAKLLPMLADADAEKIFRLLNPEILGLAHEDKGCKIKDEQQLAAALERFVGRFGDGVYEDELVRIQLAGLSPPDLAAYRDAGYPGAAYCRAGGGACQGAAAFGCGGQSVSRTSVRKNG